MSPRALIVCTNWGAVFNQKSMNKSIQKSTPNKSLKSKKNDAKTDLHFNRFRNCFSWTSKFLKKVHVRESYELPSRIRVTEGSPKKKESQQRWKAARNSSKRYIRRNTFQQLMQKPSKIDPKIVHEIWCKKGVKKWRRGGDRVTPHPSRNTPISKVLRR